MLNITPKAAIAGALGAILAITACAAESREKSGHWVTVWGAAVHTPIPFPGFPPPPVIENQTVRMVVRPTIAGRRLRLRISNAFGDSPLAIGAVHIARIQKGAAIVPSSDRAVTFGAEASFRVPSGAVWLSDPIDLNVKPFEEIAVSLFIPGKTPTSTCHSWAQHETYISTSGDFSANVEIPNATKSPSWFWLSGFEVWAPKQTAAIIALGDSITDGFGAKQGEYGDFPDLLAKRLAQKSAIPSLAVVNEGIAGNRLLHGGAGVSALARLDRDVIAQPGIANLIVEVGLNDIGWSHMPLPPKGAPPTIFNRSTESVTAEEIILGLRQIIDRAHQHRLRVFGATLSPFEGAIYFSAEGETVRQKVNKWIRSDRAFDGVFDFDAALRDPNHPSQIRIDYQSGDRLHPSEAGYRAMVDAFDISLLQKKPPRPRSR